ncbi:host cell division inhibitor Icd-like protein [Salmonella enterica]|nr:host cell division inhibitor Icd-like protein [Salmonella enterica]
MNFFSLKINQKATLLNFFCLQGLTLPHVLAYRYSAPYKTGAGFDSLIALAGSRLVSDMRFFCARYITLPRIMAGRSGEALRPAGFQCTSLSTPLRLATMFDSVLARLHKTALEAANMANSPQSQLVIFPFVCAVDPRTRECSKPAAADSVEGSDNA